MKFFTSLSTGHSGTKWLAQVLNTSERVTCHHELKLNMHRSIPKLRFGSRLWKYAEEYDIKHFLEPNAYIKYANSLASVKTEYVGDIQSWNPMTLATLRGTTISPKLIIHLVRNGIQVVHSLHNTNLDVSMSEPFFYRALLKQCHYFKIPFITGKEPFYYWCLYWRVVNCPTALSKSTVQYKLEDLTKDISQLERHFPGCRFQEVEEQNRKISGNRDPEHLWNSWTPKQQDIFIEQCKDTMDIYGYITPSN